MAPATTIRHVAAAAPASFFFGSGFLCFYSAGRFASTGPWRWQLRLDIHPLSPNEELAALTMPTLFVGGTKYALRSSAKIVDRLRRLVPNLTIELIEGGGHAINDTISAILPFLLADKNPD